MFAYKSVNTYAYMNTAMYMYIYIKFGVFLRDKIKGKYILAKIFVCFNIDVQYGVVLENFLIFRTIDEREG